MDTITQFKDAMQNPEFTFGLSYKRLIMKSTNLYFLEIVAKVLQMTELMTLYWVNTSLSCVILSGKKK